MKSILKGLLRLVAMMLWVAFGFCWGAFAGAKYCEWWVVPRWAKVYPHDGQLGLGVLAYAVGGGLLCAAVALFIGIILVVRHREGPDERLAVLDSLDGGARKE